MVIVHANGKQPRIDVIGTQMQMSYRMLVRHFFQILYDDAVLTTLSYTWLIE